MYLSASAYPCRGLRSASACLDRESGTDRPDHAPATTTPMARRGTIAATTTMPIRSISAASGITDRFIPAIGMAGNGSGGTADGAPMNGAAIRLPGVRRFAGAMALTGGTVIGPTTAGKAASAGIMTAIAGAIATETTQLFEPQPWPVSQPAMVFL